MRRHLHPIPSVHTINWHRISTAHPQVKAPNFRDRFCSIPSSKCNLAPENPSKTRQKASENTFSVLSGGIKTPCGFAGVEGGAGQHLCTSRVPLLDEFLLLYRVRRRGGEGGDRSPGLGVWSLGSRFLGLGFGFSGLGPPASKSTGLRTKKNLRKCPGWSHVVLPHGVPRGDHFESSVVQFHLCWSFSGTNLVT